MRVRLTVLLAVCMVLAPATGAVAQSDTGVVDGASDETPTGDDGSSPAGSSDEDNIAAVHETEDHIVVEVTVPASAYEPDGQMVVSGPIAGAEVGGQQTEEGYRLTVSAEPAEGQATGPTIDQGAHEVEAVLEQAPGRPLPVLAEHAEDTLEEQLGTLHEQIAYLADETEATRDTARELRQQSLDAGQQAQDQPLTQNTTEVLERRIDYAFQLLLQAKQDLAWLSEPAREAPASEVLERLGAADAAVQLAYILLATSQQVIEDQAPEDLGLGTPDEADQLVQDLDESLEEHTSWLVEEYREERDRVFRNLWWAWDGVGTALIDDVFLAVDGALYPDDGGCEEQDGDECGNEGGLQDQLPLEAIRALLATVEQESRDMERTAIDAIGDVSTGVLDDELPETYPEELNLRPTYDQLDENMSALAQEGSPTDATGDWSSQRVNDSVDAARAIDAYLRWLYEDWLANHPEPLADHGLDENLRKMLDASREQLNVTQERLNELSSGGGGSEDDGGGDDGDTEDDATLVQQAWEATNRSHENVSAALESVQDVLYSERPVEEALAEVNERAQRPTTFRVLVPKEVPDSGSDEAPEPGDDVLGEEPQPDDVVEDPDPDAGDDAEETLQDETPGEGPEPPDADAPVGDEDALDDSEDGLGGGGGGSDDGGSDGDDGTDDEDGGADGDDGAGDEGETGSEDDGSGSADDEGSGAGSQDGDDPAGDEGAAEDEEGAATHEVLVQPTSISVDEGTQRVANVEVTNEGDEEQTFHVTAEQDGPVAVDAPEEAEATLAPGESGELRTRVTPTGPGEATVTYHVTGEDDTASESATVTVQRGGDEPDGVEVSLRPWAANLAVDETASAEIAVTNDGDATHHLTLDAWADGPVDPTLERKEVEVAPGETETVGLDLAGQADGRAEVTARAAADEGAMLEPAMLVNVGDAPGFESGLGSADAAEDAGGEEDGNVLPHPALAGALAAVAAALALPRRRD
jgi:hypothetical protein